MRRQFNNIVSVAYSTLRMVLFKLFNDRFTI